MRKLLILFVLAGCYTPKKADKQLAKAMYEYPEKVAFICKDEFPCTPKKRDTLVKVEYDLIEVECPDGQIPFTSRDSTDTVYIVKYNEKRFTKEVRIPCESKIITQYIEDSAKIKDLSDRLSESDKNFNKATKKAQTYKRYTLFLSLLVLLILAYYLVRKWFKRQS